MKEAVFILLVLPELKIANLALDTDLLPAARDLVNHLLADKTKLSKDENRLLTYVGNKVAERQALTRSG